jgi:site-specific recombinase XerD
MPDLTPRAAAIANLPAELIPLVEDVEGYIAGSLSKNTLRSYESDWRQFTAWCEEYGRSALPADPGDVALFAAHLVRLGRKVSTIERKMAAIKYRHHLRGYESPTNTAGVETVLAGIRRAIGREQKGKAPATTPRLREMVASCDTTLIGLRDRALLLLGFAGAFRRSALVALDVEDLDFQDGGIVVTIRRDKTDQEGEGREIGIPYGSDPATCPVRAVRNWLTKAQITMGALFRSCSPKGTSVKDQRLGDGDVARIIKRRCKLAGLDPKRYAGHSLRAGFATSAALAGVQERVIAEQTGHKNMLVLRKYIRKGTLFAENAATKVGL